MRRERRGDDGLGVVVAVLAERRSVSAWPGRCSPTEGPRRRMGVLSGRRRPGRPACIGAASRGGSPMSIATPSTAPPGQDEIEYPASDGQPMAETGIHVQTIFQLFEAFQDHLPAT